MLVLLIRTAVCLCSHFRKRRAPAHNVHKLVTSFSCMQSVPLLAFVVVVLILRTTSVARLIQHSAGLAETREHPCTHRLIIMTIISIVDLLFISILSLSWHLHFFHAFPAFRTRIGMVRSGDNRSIHASAYRAMLNMHLRSFGKNRRHSVTFI